MKFPDINYKLRTNTKEDRNANIIKNMICTIDFEGETFTLGKLINYDSGECVFIENHAIELKEMKFRNIDEAKAHIEAVVEDYCVSEAFYSEQGVPKFTD
ncbi:hypothetical protein [Enterococcus sp. AZ103]|uniref:hypothetical protein n=1 Tax=Enterococcus sp. AZ103 TaxID=2774628 RepID=UPI003F2838F4